MSSNLAGDMTLMAWIELKPILFPNYSRNFTIFDCETHQRSGFILRVCGGSRKLFFRVNRSGYNMYSLSTARLERNTFYHVAVTKKGEAITFFIDGQPDRSFKARMKRVAPATIPFRISNPNPDQSFDGLIKEVRIYNVALKTEEVAAEYKKRAARMGKDVRWFDKIAVRPFFYFNEKSIVVEANFIGITPVDPDCQVAIQLCDSRKNVIETKQVEIIPKSGTRDFTFELKDLPKGEYEIRALVKGREGVKSQNSISFHYPPVTEVPTPQEKLVPPLPAPLDPIPYRIRVPKGGGFVIRLGEGDEYPVESFYSYPYGGANKLLASSVVDRGGEPAWDVQTKKAGPSSYKVKANGEYYTIERVITLHPNRISVKDKLVNKSDKEIGIILSNQIDTKGKTITSACMGGYSAAFIKTRDAGLGIIPFDDVSAVQARTKFEKDCVGFHNDTFALDKEASYAFEWAIYVLGKQGNYYDFINQMRKDEGRNGKVDGGFAFIPRRVPTKEHIELRGIRYGCFPVLKRIADDPELTLEGLDLVEFPKERERVRRDIEADHEAHPDLKLGFHIAHSLYLTNKPGERFPDSKQVDESGKHLVYSGEAYYWSPHVQRNYISKRRVEEGWRWYVYYPTLHNSYGEFLVKSADVLIDEIGCDFAFLDGFAGMYGGKWIYDECDGHSADIDAETKTIIRKKGSVVLLSQDAMVAFSRKMNRKGAAVIANNSIFTRTVCKENYIIHVRECFADTYNHLSPTPVTLGIHSGIRSEVDVYYDVYDKLQMGSLYFYYGEGEITHRSLPSEMYPITFEEIHSGYIKGRERLITAHTGVYGWRDSGDVHFVHLYDGRGREIPNTFLTTIDKKHGIRTQIVLGEMETAVLKKIPVSITTSSALNVHTQRYDRDGIVFILNGGGKVGVSVRDGEFGISGNDSYLINTGDTQKTITAAKSTLSFPLVLDGATKLEIVKK